MINAKVLIYSVFIIFISGCSVVGLEFSGDKKYEECLKNTPNLYCENLKTH